MTDKKYFENLKQVDVSKDKEKTKERVKELWAPLDKASRDKILELADIAKSTVERTYKRGNITPKLAAAMADILSINPYFLTGEADSPDGFSEDELIGFLKNKNAVKQRAGRASAKKAVKRSRKAEPAAPKAEKITAPKAVKQVTAGVSVKINDKVYSATAGELADVKKINEDETIALVRGLLLRSKYNDEAGGIADMVKFLLTI